MVTGPVVDFTTSQARASCKNKALKQPIYGPIAIWSNAYFSCYRGSKPLAHAALRLNGRNVHDFIVRWYSELLVAEQQQKESRRRSQFRPMAWIMLLNGRARCLFNGGPRKTHQSASIIPKPLTLGPSIRFKQFKHSSNCNQHSEEADETLTDEIRHSVFH